MLLGGCHGLSGHGCRRGRSLLLASAGWLVPRGAGGWRLCRRQWHRSRVAEAAFEQPLSLAVQAQPFVLLQENRRKSPVEILGASPQQGSSSAALLVGHLAMVQRLGSPKQKNWLWRGMHIAGTLQTIHIQLQPIPTLAQNPEMSSQRYQGCGTGIAHSPQQSLSITSSFIAQPCGISVLSKIKQSKADYYRSLTLLNSIQLLSHSSLFSLIQ